MTSTSEQVSKTRSGTYLRNETKTYYTSLEELKNDSRAIFDSSPFIEERARAVEGRSVGIRERMIRVPFGYEHSSSLVKEELTKFLYSTKSRQVEVFVTANVILVNNERQTYSVFYGQDFNDDYKYAVAGPSIVKNALDLSPLLRDFTEGDVADIFEKIFLDESSVSVERVVNQIYIIRGLYKTK